MENEANKTSDDGEEIADPLAHFAHKKRRFLESFAKEGNVKGAALRAGVARRSHSLWMKNDPAYREAFEDAVEDFADSMEAEADRRGRDGYDKPVFQGGEEVGTVRVYSDTLLVLRLKALRPEKYRDNPKVVPNTEASVDHEAALAEIREQMNNPDYREYLRQQELLRVELGIPDGEPITQANIVRHRLNDPEYTEFLEWRQARIRAGQRAEAG